MDFSRFNGSERMALNQYIQKKEMKDFMKLYSNLVFNCFNDCSEDFTSRTLSTNERTCSENCVGKFLKHSERIGARFSEYNAEMMNNK
ncbi:hypothetical protein E3Q22_00428 [Wallemia mellicola]|uniref:Mitochondrial import inner membrane translocase subunit n=2 Tax=Wallemia mellicola TaxID=1708541 RepID=A0A4T0R3P9_9BASI|nr:mitochondrial import inner membrane translocase subunit TIM9 [Wallemia mellicola CBS 633.66]TIB73256.1 hypothetical protein E3Q24_01231 [Wallemia mellicola]EIM21151.1 mitochondrial import inner membrane translocase subunit TIM9 [Wallemia mellicola CBS 633.66]TIB76792.1 hypothetical protein E3Q23_01654 [Wallemia mellicola]TIB82082.1 hypothetical protein E3Q22_00428 [Wallemia mellicola]TIB87701.1 hypothetical protein E3Q21_01191 [Wallemia mellicola]|eukprot:XP_006958825.1 mitochondrial import inner membrane translocase subunit TIM9 [Wallemia mellicola CBS 633.66]